MFFFLGREELRDEKHCGIVHIFHLFFCRFIIILFIFYRLGFTLVQVGFTAFQQNKLFSYSQVKKLVIKLNRLAPKIVKWSYIAFDLCPI